MVVCLVHGQQCGTCVAAIVTARGMYSTSKVYMKIVLHLEVTEMNAGLLYTVSCNSFSYG